MKIQYLVVLFYANEQIVLPLTFNEKAKWLFDGCLTYTSATLRVAVKHPPNNSLKLG